MQLRRRLNRCLHDCIRRKDLVGGRKLLKDITQSEFRLDPLLSAHVIRLFALCGSLDEADELFNGLPKSNPHIWRAIISAHANFGNTITALGLFRKMLRCHVEPCVYTFIALLKTCSCSVCVDYGVLFHIHIVESGFESNVYLASTLIGMYAKCHRLEDAKSVFECSEEKNVVSWTAIISGYARMGQGNGALQYYNQMQQNGIDPNHVTYVCILKACSSEAATNMGRLCHGQIIEGNHELMHCDEIASSLIDMYVKCGKIEDARSVFEIVPNKTTVAWTAMIIGYAQTGNDHEAPEAFYLFQQMQQEGIEACQVTFVSILTACFTVCALSKGKFIHTQIMANAFESDIFVANALVNMYSKCGSLLEAHKVFDRLPKRDIVTWTTIVAAYAEKGFVKEAFMLFTQAEKEGIDPDKYMFGSILKACSKVSDLVQGRHVHSYMLQTGCTLEVFIGSSLVDMYAKCGSIEDAQQVFDKLTRRNVVTWSALIAGYVQLGCEQEALQLFEQMQNDGLVPDDVTLVCLLKACSNKASLSQGKLLHEQSIGNASEENVFVGNTLIDLYMKCGKVKDALGIFNQLSAQHPVVWSSVIAGLADYGYYEAALMLFQQMKHEGLEADTVTYVCVLKVCSRLGALEQGKLVHAQIKQWICETDCFVASSLIDMYANCGNLVNAKSVFDGLIMRNVVVWSAIIAGYAENSDYPVALHYFIRMQHDGIEPVDVTYTSLLCACNRQGLIREGCHHFECMVKQHGIEPTLDHYNCMIDLVGRVGYLHEARDILLSMPVVPCLVTWMSLLSHCRMHGSVNLGGECYENVVVIDDQHASCYELMSKLYVDSSQFDKADRIQEKRRQASARKKIGMAFIEVGNQVHTFVVGNKGPEVSSNSAYIMPHARMRMRQEGYIPYLDSVLLPLHECGDETSCMWY